MSREQRGHGYWAGVFDAQSGNVRRQFNILKECDELLLLASKLSFGKPILNINMLKAFLEPQLPDEGMKIVDKLLKFIDENKYRKCEVLISTDDEMCLYLGSAKEQILDERKNKQEEK